MHTDHPFFPFPAFRGIQCGGSTAVLAGERLDCLDNQGKGRGKDGSDVKASFCLAAGGSLFLRK